MKSRKSTVPNTTARPLQTVGWFFPPRKRTFRKCFRKVDFSHFIFDHPLGSPSTIEMHRITKIVENQWKPMIFDDFKDFMKTNVPIITGTPLQNVRGLFPPRKRAFRRCLSTFEHYFSFFLALCGRIWTVKIPRLHQITKIVENQWKSLKPMIFIEFQLFWRFCASL